MRPTTPTATGHARRPATRATRPGRPAPPTAGRRIDRRRLAGVVAASVALGVVAGMLVPFVGPATAQEPLAYTVTLDPAGPYVDGQAVTVRITGEPGMRVTNSGFCHPDMPPATSQEDLTEWCTSTVGNGATGGTVPADPSGVVELGIRIGSGAAEKTAPALGTSHSWRCDDTSPCRLALVITPARGSATFDTSTLLTYRDDDPTAGCGGPADDQFATAAPDRLTEAWVAWTVGRCAGTGVATTSSFTNDGSALAQFEAGSVDLAYSGVPAGTDGFGPATRPSIHTPVALNATVLAVAGYQPEPSSVPGVPLWRPIDDVRLSTDEANALLSGRLTLDEGLQDSLKARNPQLAEQGTSIGFASPSSLAGPQATTRGMTALLAARKGDDWAYPTSASKYGEQAGTPLGTFADYNTLTNSLAMINLFSGKPQLVGDIYKKLAEKPQAVSLVSFYLTDLATARQLALTPVALQDAAGTYVLPTPDTLAAAVPAMTTADDGTRSLDPTTVTGAYPLTYVEYAVSPSTTVLDEACAPVAGGAERLRAWVGYLADDGQTHLDGTGLVALPDDLRTAAVATVERIAAAEPTTGPCAPETPTPTTTPVTTPTTSLPDAAGGLPIGGGFGSGLPGGDLGSLGAGAPNLAGGAPVADPTDGRADAADAESVAEAEEVASRTTVPRLPGPIGAGLLVSALTLPLLVGLTSATGWLSGGRATGRAGRSTAVPA